MQFVRISFRPAEAGQKSQQRAVHEASNNSLTADDVKRIITQAVVQAEASGLKATIVVLDKEGNGIGAFRMRGAPNSITIPAAGPLCFSSTGFPACNPLPGPSAFFAAISKAGTGAFLSSQGHAFSTRTASFIVQEHFPPDIDFVSGGPLFGVQFSQLPCGDIVPPFIQSTPAVALPLGLSADPGGVPLYKNGQLAGGVGVEGGDAIYLDVRDQRDQPVEELVAIAATRGFEAPAAIRGNQIIVNGIRFPYVNTPLPDAIPLASFDRLSGEVLVAPRAAFPSTFQIVNVSGVTVRVRAGRFPPKAGTFLSTEDVLRILVQGVRQANITRAAIRRPLGSPAEVNLTVVDVDGTVLGIVSTPDAPMFGFDVSAQKARTAAFFSRSEAASLLSNAGLGKYVDAASSDGVRLDGSVAFSDRAIGFLARPFFPDGINDTIQGAFSVPEDVFSPFNTGLQLDLVADALAKIFNTGMIDPSKNCTKIPGLNNGIQIFAGSVPLYKNGQLVGAIGVSGDGIDQDDLVAAMGSAGFEAPPDRRSDRVFVRDVRLPYVKFPRHPNL